MLAVTRNLAAKAKTYLQILLAGSKRLMMHGSPEEEDEKRKKAELDEACSGKKTKRETARREKRRFFFLLLSFFLFSSFGRLGLALGVFETDFQADSRRKLCVMILFLWGLGIDECL